MLIASVGCGKQGKTDKDDSSATEAKSEQLLDLSGYRIVRAADALPGYSHLFTKFRISLKRKTGLDLSMVDDSEPETESEILLGDTNRILPGDAVPDVGTGYSIRYVDGKIAIYASTLTAMEMALDYFLDSLQDGSHTLRYPIDHSVYMAEEDADCLRGITINAIGDSYFYGDKLGKDKVWLSLLANELGLTVNNYGVNGSTVSAYVDQKAMVNRYQEMRSGADIVIIEGGRNDYNVKAPLGDLESRDPKTYAGALNIMIEGIRKQNPNALIVGITSWYVNADMKRYSDMMLAVFQSHGLPCMDAADQDKTGVYMNNAAFRKQYCQTENDVSHLNAEGMKLVLPVFRAFLAESYREFLSQRKTEAVSG